MKISGPNSAQLQALISRLSPRKVTHWALSVSYNEDNSDPAPMKDANIVGSRWGNGDARHALLLDIDHPAWLVRSSTPGHCHLYIDVPEGIPHEKYMDLLRILGECNVIEPGYADASRRRGRSDLRLPWIKKERVDE